MRHGFSLLEVMLVLFIVALLTALSVPYYSQHVLHQNRIAAATTLLKLAGALERYYLEHNSYAGATLEKLGFASVLADHHYQIQIADANAQDFLVTAQPVGKQVQDACATLTLNAAGEKNISGSGYIAQCW